METLKNFAYRLRELFADSALGEGLAVAFTGALLSGFSVGGLAPLGIAFLTAAWCSSLNPYFAFAGVAAGSLIAGSFAQAVSSGLIMAVIFFTMNRFKLHRAYRYLIMAAAMLAAYPVFGELTLEGAASYFGGTCLTVLIALLMTHALLGVYAIRGRRLLSDEQLLTVALLGGMIALSFGNFRLLGISPGAIFTALVCMYAAYAKGIAGVACAAAVACGRVLGCSGDLLLIAVLCSCTLLCSCMRMFGRWGVCGGFVFPSLIFAMLVNGTGTLTIVETVISGAVFALTPRGFLELLEYNSAAKRTEQMQLRLDFIIGRLVALSRVLQEMSRLFENGEGNADGFIHRQLAGVSDSLCRLVKEDGRRRRKGFFVEVGCACCPKSGNTETGDSLSVREIDGRLMAAISDGMGSGHDARRESMQTVELMCDLMSVGFQLDEAAECVNRLLMLREDKEMYATLDAALFDPAAGMMSLAKHGAPPSYILRNGKLSTLYAEALPVGIIEDARPAVCNVDMQRGDIVIMMSDGIADALGSELIAAVTERTISAETADDAANSLLDLARRKGRTKDDMSVIVAMVG